MAGLKEEVGTLGLFVSSEWFWIQSRDGIIRGLRLRLGPSQ